MYHPHLLCKTLYRLVDGHWQYLRLTWQPTQNGFVCEKGYCGYAPTAAQEWLPKSAHETPLAGLARCARWGNEQGYQAQLGPLALDIVVALPPHQGFFAAAPWFEAFKGGLWEPLMTGINEYANAQLYGHFLDGTSDRYQYRVFAAEPAEALLQTLAEGASAGCSLRWTIQPASHLAEALAGDSSAKSITAFAARTVDPTHFYPDLNWPLVYPNRVRGSAASAWLERLRHTWGFAGSFWPPLGGKSLRPIVHTAQLTEEEISALLTVLQPHLRFPIFQFEANEGLLQIEPEEIFSIGLDDCISFDSSLDWVVYLSHEQTLTYGGEVLVAAVRQLLADQPERIDPWYQ